MIARFRALPSAARDTLVSVGIFLLAIGLCCLLSLIHDDNNPFAPQVFTLAVALISYCTRSYLPGILCSVLGVVCVNVLFTQPFFHFNMTGVGYPLTFLVMLIVSLLVSALTTRARREEQMRFAAETERIRGGLLRAISHDLRTPLTGIIGCSSALLENETLTPDQRRTLTREIQSGAQDLLRMTENILSVTRSQEGVTLQKTTEAVEEILSAAILKFRRNTGSLLPISIRMGEDVVLAPMDAMLMEQVFVNLLENVERHAQGATGVQINVRQQGKMVEITLSDDGCGFRADDAQRTGIGLLVCRAILTAHGGSFDVTATDIGTTARVTIPAEEEQP